MMTPSLRFCGVNHSGRFTAFASRRSKLNLEIASLAALKPCGAGQGAQLRGRLIADLDYRGPSPQRISSAPGECRKS